MTLELASVVVVVPAYQPEPLFGQLVLQIREAGFAHLLVVDDGSSADSAGAFEAARAAGATVIEHAVNQGKGQALKTAFAWVLQHHPDAAGLVTCDADGQHLVADVVEVARAFLRSPSGLTLGARRFGGGTTPWRSRLGNEISRVVFRLLIGRALTDTQTGLRGIPRAFLPELLELKTARYDFELDMLILACRSHLPIQEVPIATVYSADNAHSHFDPALDSLRIYFVFVRFLMASFLSAAIDFAVFSCAVFLSGRLLASMGLARLAAGLVNFWLGRRFTFKSSGPLAAELAKYWLLVGFYLLISYSLVRTVSETTGASVYLAKLGAEAVLFGFSFLVQRSYVFRSPTRRLERDTRTP